ncbi:hypothetical protein [Numidum massiliense]|uniref:hypothetical protein n=1 Tax=Numidum massiliense TaxID=1522315 RepID=UPI0012FA530C|nr:hypothetical protein [Numidum massiliense]
MLFLKIPDIGNPMGEPEIYSPKPDPEILSPPTTDVPNPEDTPDREKERKD